MPLSHSNEKRLRTSHLYKRHIWAALDDPQPTDIYIVITTLATVKPFVFFLSVFGQLVKKCLLLKDLDLSSPGSSSLVDIYHVRKVRLT